VESARDIRIPRPTESEKLLCYSMVFLEVIRLIKKGDVFELRHALEDGLNPNHSNEIGTTLLMLAAMEGNTATGGLLIDRGAELDRENDRHDSALTLAAWFRHPKFVRMLLDRGASLDRIRDNGSLDSFFRWVEKYCGVTTERINDLRETT
jgi:ankyrin repeat protein